MRFTPGPSWSKPQDVHAQGSRSLERGDHVNQGAETNVVATRQLLTEAGMPNSDKPDIDPPSDFRDDESQYAEVNEESQATEAQRDRLLNPAPMSGDRDWRLTPDPLASTVGAEHADYAESFNNGQSVNQGHFERQQARQRVFEVRADTIARVGNPPIYNQPREAARAGLLDAVDSARSRSNSRSHMDDSPAYPQDGQGPAEPGQRAEAFAGVHNAVANALRRIGSPRPPGEQDGQNQPDSSRREDARADMHNAVASAINRNRAGNPPAYRPQDGQREGASVDAPRTPPPAASRTASPSPSPRRSR